jgi:putative oxidoreductase
MSRPLRFSGPRSAGSASWKEGRLHPKSESTQSRKRQNVNRTLTQIQKLYELFVRVAIRLQAPFLTIVRVYWGWQISENGWGKLHNLAHVTEFFASLGLPAPGPTAAFVATFEFVGGILLAIGLLSRIAALGLAIDMTTAYITADREAFFSFFSDPGKFYNADPFIFLLVGVMILIFGPGKISADAFWQHVLRKRELRAGTTAIA